MLDAAGVLIYERVEIYNMDTGARFATYVIEAPRGSGIIGLNGAAARFAMPGDKITVIAYASFDEAEAEVFQPRVVLVDRNNGILSRSNLNGMFKLVVGGYRQNAAGIGWSAQ